MWLRPNLRFHDGSPVTADAVRQSLELSLQSPPQLIQYPMLRDISRIEVEDDRTVVIRARRYPALLVDDLEIRIVKQGPDGQVSSEPAVSSLRPKAPKRSSCARTLTSIRAGR